MTFEFRDDDPSCLCRDAARSCPAAEGEACDRATFDVAARWIARQPAATEAERQAFEAWLAESECHRCVWARVRYLWRLLGEALSAPDASGRAGGAPSGGGSPG